MLVRDLIKMLKDKDQGAKVIVMIGNDGYISLEDLDSVGTNECGDEVYIPANFDSICTHQVEGRIN